jgi:uracil-DNA glycosylase family 4
MNRELAGEAYELIASARALVAELLEEGVESFERLPEPVESASLVAPSSEPSVAPAPPVAIPAPVAVANAAAVAEAVQPASGVRTLEQVRDELGDCRRCGLCEDRKNIVFGEGNPNAALMFIGEGPGEQEDNTGRPFVGRAGELLTQMIEKGLGIARDDVYICNIVKCRPPQNRNPLPPEVSACRAFLDGQIDAVAPKVIVSLGKPAASLLLDRNVAITRERGTLQSYRGTPLMPTLHPAYILRQYTPENRRLVWEDLKAAYAKAESS